MLLFKKKEERKMLLVNEFCKMLAKTYCRDLTDYVFENYRITANDIYKQKELEILPSKVGIFTIRCCYKNFISIDLDLRGANIKSSILCMKVDEALWYLVHYDEQIQQSKVEIDICLSDFPKFEPRTNTRPRKKSYKKKNQILLESK